MSTIALGFGVLLALVLLVALAGLFLVSRLFKKVSQGRALIISKMRKVEVTFTGAIVLPVLHKAEFMDISVKTIEIDRVGRDGLICRDNIRADIRITFFVRVNKTVEDVIKVAQAIGTTRASDQATLQELFSAKFSEALKTVGKHLDFVDLYTQRNEFRDRIIAVIGTDLNGYSLEDAAIDYLEQTPLTQLDAQNILDAQGIRKITELTAIEHVRTNEFRRQEEKEITRQNVEAREAVLELERQQADAENRQRREVETLRAREDAEILRVQAEERLKARTAFLRTEEALGIQEQNKDREIAVAEKNRERVIAIESERIEKDRLLEVTDRDRAVSLAQIANERELETERRTVSEVVRERVAVDKTVAEQEERINRLRAVEAAERERQAIVIRAEADAQEHLVKDIKAAEAAEAAARFKAKETLTLAEAEQQAAELQARAKIRLAEASQAESAAYGLGQAQVREREADAIEKVGRAEAAALRERNLAEAEGLREKLKGEAEGLEDKAAAMAALDDATREHEEYRLRLELEKEVELAKVHAHREVAAAQAKVLATGLEQANIDIVGGESVFLDRLVGSIGLGKGLDRLLHTDTGAAASAVVGSLLARNGSDPAASSDSASDVSFAK
ncbi:putative membrane protein YqiK, contains Band7/PHB/SPFH domain [Nocardia amikacinitolerans]|uniref:SPFH domain-containing protein n=1 Tax=Nocardia amikacinitolerans TaxID=756689 RepID=UPI000AE9A615|nr:flotillin family protein [Nocardia amikacinitolerans]MCP2319806.1 putative membrane protein YqiK, contains Band7/PHB/SPFH domain [Nocardia amikacinitolerans]